MNEDDDSEFARLVPGVRRLRQDRTGIFRERDRNGPLPRAAREGSVAPDEEPSRSAPVRDTCFNSGMQKKLQRRIRQGLIRPEASLDLHGMRQQEALRALRHFLDDALQRGMRMVVVIHGQGYRSQSDAVLKPLVQRWLAARPEVLAWCPAQPRDGAAGASYVYLRGG